MLLSLLLAKTSILPCFFFLFLVILSNFFIIPVVNENISVKIGLAIPTGDPITEIIGTHTTFCRQNN